MGYILDVWGEGRVIDGEEITGFVEADNLNYVGQKVSNGINAGQAIPRLIPVDN
ncbi:hypothetical protein [Pandoraea pulmonicola]|uniref:Uncharacterized protein n=1 Tax=Pandoraea pulmonicola TaxID=93221 RepID=A0AAJ4ZGY5_PANPU|nr:hypothetical protein [Pandoraea pulmonicola]SUA93223.1 Uncharacterised protein [Pandoraea pulmonicola]